MTTPSPSAFDRAMEYLDSMDLYEGEDLGSTETCLRGDCYRRTEEGLSMCAPCSAFMADPENETDPLAERVFHEKLIQGFGDQVSLAFDGMLAMIQFREAAIKSAPPEELDRLDHLIARVGREVEILHEDVRASFLRSTSIMMEISEGLDPNNTGTGFAAAVDAVVGSCCDYHRGLAERSMRAAADPEVRQALDHCALIPVEYIRGMTGNEVINEYFPLMAVRLREHSEEIRGILNDAEEPADTFGPRRIERNPSADPVEFPNPEDYEDETSWLEALGEYIGTAGEPMGENLPPYVIRMTPDRARADHESGENADSIRSVMNSLRKFADTQGTDGMIGLLQGDTKLFAGGLYAPPDKSLVFLTEISSENIGEWLALIAYSGGAS